MNVNRGYAYREQIGGDGAGEQLSVYLARRYPHSAAAEWQRRIDRGLVRLDDRPARGDTRLRAGQWLVWHRPPWSEPATPAGFAVLYRDDDLLAVAKPAGLPTLPGAGFLESTLLARVRRHDPAAAPLHRLGRWTSGVVLCARTRAARRLLSECWSSGLVEKRYRALAGGRPAWNERTIEMPIGPVPHERLGSVHARSASGKPARSRVRVVERRDDVFLADVIIESGRPHQIRIHLAAAGHPLVGDPLYGAGGLPRDGRALPGDPGYRLHAMVLALPHPRDGRRVTIRCEPPADLRSSLD